MIYNVYVKTDKNSCIIDVQSSFFETEDNLKKQGYKKIDEGTDGEVYGHAQPNYLKTKYGLPNYDDNDLPNYKYILGKIIKLTDLEKNIFFKKEDGKSDIELLNERLEKLEKAILSLKKMITDFLKAK